MIEILKTSDPTVIAAAQARLRAEAIDSFALDVHTSATLGAPLAFPQRLMVLDEDAPRARVVLWREGLLDRG